MSNTKKYFSYILLITLFTVVWFFWGLFYTSTSHNRSSDREFSDFMKKCRYDIGKWECETNRDSIYSWVVSWIWDWWNTITLKSEEVIKINNNISPHEANIPGKAYDNYELLINEELWLNDIVWSKVNVYIKSFSSRSGWWVKSIKIFVEVFEAHTYFKYTRWFKSNYSSNYSQYESKIWYNKTQEVSMSPESVMIAGNIRAISSNLLYTESIFFYKWKPIKASMVWEILTKELSNYQ